MKVILLIDNMARGGKERQLSGLFLGLVRREEISVRMVILGNDLHFSELEEYKLLISRFPRKCKSDLSFVPALNRLIKEFRPDIVHSWNPLTTLFALPFKYLYGFRLIDGSIRWAPPARMIPAKVRWMNKLNFLGADRVVSNSQAGLVSHNIGRKGTFIHNGLNVSTLYNQSQTEQAAVPWQDPPSLVVGMVGNFSPHKDHATFFKAAELVREVLPAVKFIAAGGGENLEYWRRKLGDKPGYFLPGQVKNAPEIIRHLSIGVLCSSEIGEGISNAILEYMAMKKPVVATDCPGNREVIEDGVNGILIPPTDPVQLAATIIELLNDTEKRSALALKGFDTVTKKFSYTVMIEKYCHLYQQLLK